MATITLNSSGEQAELICFGMGMVRSFLLGLVLLTNVLSWKSTLIPSMITITGCLFQPSCWMFNLISFKRTFRQSLENRGRLRPLSMTSLRGAPSGVISLEIISGSIILTGLQHVKSKYLRFRPLIGLMCYHAINLIYIVVLKVFKDCSSFIWKIPAACFEFGFYSFLII